MSKPVLAIDIDEVLSFHNAALSRFHNREYGTNHTADEYHDDWDQLWGVPLEEMEKRAAAWHSSEDIKNMDPRPGAIEALKKLTVKYELVVLTGRSKQLGELTEEWLDRHFPKVFSKVHFAGLWEEGRGKTKADYCRLHNITTIIDDNVKQVLACHEAGIRAILFGDYNWNQLDELPEGVKRLTTWDQVVSELL